MTLEDKQYVCLGAGDFYLVAWPANDTLPEDATLEVEANKIAHIEKGASIEYKAEMKEVEDAMGVIVKSFVAKEDVRLKLGYLSWNLNQIKQLVQTGTLDEDTTNSTRTIKIGNKTRTAAYYVARFVHTKDDGKKIRVTVKGQNIAGFSLGFDKDNPVVINPEFRAYAQDSDGTLLIIEEEVNPAS